MTTNLPKKEIEKTQTQTQTYFDGYFEQPVTVSQNEVDVVNAFFLRLTNNNTEAAQAYTGSVLSIAKEQKVSPVTIVEDFENQDTSKITRRLLTLLNNNRLKTSLLGVKKTAKVNPFVARNIIP